MLGNTIDAVDDTVRATTDEGDTKDDSSGFHMSARDLQIDIGTKKEKNNKKEKQIELHTAEDRQPLKEKNTYNMPV